MRRFNALLDGLSAESVFRQVARGELSVVDDPDRIRAALRG